MSWSWQNDQVACRGRAPSSQRSVTSFAAGLLLLVFAQSASRAQLISDPNLSVQQELRHTYLEQKLGSGLPAGAHFLNDAGRDVRLGDYFGQVPTLFILGYFQCPDLCPMTFEHLTEEINGIGPIAGENFQVIIVSFDPTDTPARAAMEKRSCLRAYKRPDQAEGFHFLTGSQRSIDAVTRAAGFHYCWDQAEKKFVHPAGVMVLSPAGRITHCFFGIDASPADVESALHDAVLERTTPVDTPDQEYCVDYDPTQTPRGKIVNRIINGVCVGWVVLLFSYIGYKFSGEFHRRKPRLASHGPSDEVES